MIAVMNVPKASAAAAAEAVPEHMGALSVGNDYGYDASSSSSRPAAAPSL